MSRIGKRPVAIPSGTDIKVAGSTVTVKGKLGSLSQDFHPSVTVKVEGEEALVSVPSESKRHKELHGLSRALLQNMVTGVNDGFKKELEIVGVGWNAKMKGKQVSLQIGFCHTVDMDVPQGIAVDLPKPQELIITGIDKQAVGQFAAEIRAVRPPEPYKGKGVRYSGEYVIRKEGKSQVGK